MKKSLFLLSLFLLSLVKGDQMCSDPYAEGWKGCGVNQETGQYHPCECRGMYHAEWQEGELTGPPSNCKHPNRKCRSYCRPEKCSCRRER